MYNQHDIQNAKGILARNPDGTIANKQARERAINLLAMFSRDLTEFKNLKPDSPVALILHAMILEIDRIIILAKNATKG